MYLKSLEIHGFKSFPDKTVLNFNKGITAVVGPNGSGKSNIGDAMRWVMGEQSSKALRGDKMSGVIFHGTQTRPKAPFAQVTITIDNEDRALEFDSDAVSISRKLYRNGDSEYMINGNGVRLKDVTELLMDTGLGKDGYSIVGQGRIADIVNGKSNERREMFEEAAGIAKFRYKKKEAEDKLLAAEDNISRLNDILSELESRIEPLRKQCEKAKKFRELDEQKRKLEVSVWVCRLDGFMKKIEEYTERLKLLESQYNDLADELEDDENAISDYLQKSAEKSDEVDRLRAEIHRTQLENTQAGSDIAVLENDIAHLEDSIVQLKDRIEQSRSSKYYLEAELKKREKEYEEMTERQSRCSKEISEKEQLLSGLITEAEEFDKDIAEAGSAVNEVYLKKSELNFKIENAKNNLSEFGERSQQNAEELKRLEQEAGLIRSETERLEKQKQQAEEKKLESENRLKGMLKLLETKSAKLKTARENLTKADIALKETQSRLHILRDLENSMEGFNYSVKHILTASKQGRIKGVCGSVAQIISVPAEYSTAIETVLGAALQNIVVENEDSAKRGISLLKENRAGRATFLPITSVKGQRFENRGLETENGYVAMACDLVDFDDKYKGIIYSLLGRICVAEDIDLATVIAKKYGYKFRIVTLDGQVINAGGSFTGGAVSKKTGLLTRKNEIEKLELKKSSIEKEYGELNDTMQKLGAQTAKMQAESDGLKEQLNISGNECIRFEMELKNVKDADQRLMADLKQERELAEELKGKIKNSEEEISALVKELSDAEEQIRKSEESLAQSQGKQSELREKREKLSAELSQMRISAAESAKDLEACGSSIGQLKESINSSDSDSGKLEDQIEENREKIGKKNKEIENIKEKISGSDDIVKAFNEKIEAARKAHMQFDDQANFIRSKIKNKTAEKENLSEQITRSQERKKSVCEDFDKLVANLWDEYELTRTDAKNVAEDIEDITVSNRELAELKNKIRSLGNVNLGAIEEYAEVSERYEFMNGQLTDVKTSKKELEEMICDLTDNMKNIFTQSFDAINNNFKQIFTELFGGGKGELTLTDPENVLECGIDINVQPPGKVITNLMSLSGGEQALAAVAIYFSILKISPSPFCLLDEIEAALDDVNVTRYARYLHNLTDKTQFITITHRRGTMEEADVLYGVTMQEKGISKLLKMSAAQTHQMEL